MIVAYAAKAASAAKAARGRRKRNTREIVLTYLYKLVWEKGLEETAAFMHDSLIVFCTCESEDEALRIAEALVNGRLAACVNVLPGVHSIYRWKGEVERAREVLLLIKTTVERFPALRDRVGELHTYETPEIIALPVAGGSEKYLSWLEEQVSPQ
jgi:periplasmic divalent cation tolerance protein